VSNWLQWDNADYTMSFCKRIAAELRATGHRVRIDQRPPDNGRAMGRVFVWRGNA
jgi:hypothetical protein